MSILLNILVAAFFYLLPGLFNLLILRYAHRGWWGHRWFRLLTFTVPVAGLAMCCYWIFSFEIWGDWASRLGVGAFGILIMQLALACALVITGGATWLGRRLAAWRRHRRDRELQSPQNGSTDEIDPVRRRLWQGGLAALPLLAAGTSVAGVTTAAAPVRVYQRPLAIDGLPDDLAGFRILHVSDLHLSIFVRLDTLADILRQARAFAPDLIVLTGDTADDNRLLPAALDLLTDFGAPHGVYAVMGNHEYGRQIEDPRGIYAASGVRLLIDQSTRLPVGRSTIHLAGSDDFSGRKEGEIRSTFYRQHIAAALEGGGDEDFRLLLVHRPDAFDAAVAQGVDLTLAGHTHGGQIGLAGRSLLRAPQLYPYPWGYYRQGDGHLYTSSGAGHWIPFRLGCPTEAPVIELVAGG